MKSYDLTFNRNTKSVLFQILDLFPIPIEAFRSDGVSVYVNSAFLECFHIPDSSLIVGKFNALEDIYLVNDTKLAEYITCVFSGEVKSIRDVRVPFTDMLNRYYSITDVVETNDIYQDITSFPIRDEQGTIKYIITLFITKHIYKENQEVKKAKDYIKSNWREEFNIDKVADAAGFSRHHFARIFKQYTGMTPYCYYQYVILKELKIALSNKDYTVSQAFLACGIDYNGSFVKFFKELVGMTPSQYRINVQKNISVDYETGVGMIQNDNYYKYNLENAIQFLDIMPLPLIVFDIRGSVFISNRMICEMCSVSETEQYFSKINIKTDKVIIEKLGLSEYIDKIFAGELILVSDIKVPLEHFSSWYNDNSNKDIKTIYSDILFFPIVQRDQIQYIISLFLTTRTYQGEANIVKAIEFIENNWKYNLDIDDIAYRSGFSRYHFGRKFKKHTGKTPYSYYQELKIRKLKETLRDTNITVSEAFDLCGLCYHGDWANLFKEKVGMTPLEYHKALLK